jgi:dihydroorotate dehydrogenase electron transfer subunit
VHRLRAEVVGSERLPGNHHRLLLNAPAIVAEAAPGQFIHVWCHPPDELDRPPAAALLRRPYSISRLHPPDLVEILFRVGGVGGGLLGDTSKGDALDIIGPLGHGFRLHKPPRTAVIVAGGSGLAPVPFLVQQLIARGARTICLAGAKNDDIVPFRVNRPRAGRAGLPEIEAVGAECVFVCEAVEGILITEVVELRLGEFTSDTEFFAVGPRAMLKRLVEVTGPHFDLQVSLEERMACGLGACRSCVVPSAKGGYVSVCRDGPVFDANEIDWERLTT